MDWYGIAGKPTRAMESNSVQQQPNWEAYAEADKRGILPPDKKAAYEEAKRRGLVPGMEARASKRDWTSEVLGGSNELVDPFDTVQPPSSEASRPGRWSDAVLNPDRRKGARGSASADGLIDPFDEPRPAGEGQGRESMPIGDMFKEAFFNLPGSTLNFAETMAQPVLHPIDTAKSAYNLAAGTVQKAIPGEQGKEAHFDAFANMLNERYGSVENFKQTVAQDPVGVLADVAGFLSGGGAALRGAGTLGKVGKLGAVGRAVGKVANTIDPVNLATKAVTKAIPESLPGRLYSSALKMETGLRPAERARRVTAGLEEGILPTGGGLTKLQERIGELNKRIEGLISIEAAKGGKVDLNKALANLAEVRNEALMTSEPQAYLSIVTRIEDQFRYHLQKYPDGMMPADVAQRLKQGIYKEARRHYENPSKAPATYFKADAKKALARGIKDELAKLNPALTALNATDGALLALEDSIQKAVNRAQNKDLMGLGTPLTGVGVGAATGSATIGTLSAVAKWALDSPTVKATLAIALRKAKQAEARGAGKHAALYQAGRIPEESEGTD